MVGWGFGIYISCIRILLFSFFPPLPFLIMRVTNFINGNIYMDTPQIETWTTVLQFVTQIGGKHIFKYHCGANTYFENERGYIELPKGEFFPDMYEYKEPIN